MDERHKNIKPIYDLVVKKVFCNEAVALQFVQDIFDLPAKSAKLIGSDKIFRANSNVEDDFNIAVDILVELDNHAQVIIEVQLAKQAFFMNRIWAYLCKQVNDNIERLKQNEKERHAIYKKLPPVYVAAIVDKNYFDGDDPISTFLIKEETRNTELKMYIDNDIKEMPLLKIVFLELKKYKPELKESYNKVRWLEFFGNKKYTSEPGEVIDQADDLLNVRNWTKEEKDMYDERTRQLDHQWATYAYAREEGIEYGMAQGIERGRAEGRAEGIEQGRVSELIDLVKEGLLTKEIVAKKLNISEQEFEAYL